MLVKILEEEEDADELLSEIARDVNDDAYEMEEDEDADDEE